MRRHHDGLLDDRVVWIVVVGRRSTERGAVETARVHVIRLYEEMDETRVSNGQESSDPRADRGKFIAGEVKTSNVFK